MILSSAPTSQVVGAPLGKRPVGYLTKPSDLAGYRNIGRYVTDCLETSEWKESSEVAVRVQKGSLGEAVTTLANIF